MHSELTTKQDIILHGWGGAGLLIVTLILSGMGIPFFTGFFYPLALTAIILILDGIVLQYSGKSLIGDRIHELILMAPLSVMAWSLLEIYNLFTANWNYQGLNAESWLQFVYFGWLFALFLPLTVIIAEGIQAISSEDLKPRRADFLNGMPLFWAMIFGGLCVTLPVIFPGKLGVLLFSAGGIVVLECINLTAGRPSFTSMYMEGRIKLAGYFYLAGLFVFGLLLPSMGIFSGLKIVYQFDSPYAYKIVGLLLKGLWGLYLIEFYWMMTGFKGFIGSAEAAD